MAGKYWIKLYHEILHDVKMGSLSDRLWRLSIEVFLMAGEFDRDGRLPSLENMAWILRREKNKLEVELYALEETGIVGRDDGGWYVTKFSERQAKMTSAEHMQRSRSKDDYSEYFMK